MFPCSNGWFTCSSCRNSFWCKLCMVKAACIINDPPHPSKRKVAESRPTW
ncbi:hypothetical protein V6Z11_A09G176000 [Gossypium hirsutum]